MSEDVLTFLKKKTISITEASKILGTTKAGVGRLAGTGMLTAYRRGGKKMFSKLEVVRLRELRDRGVQPRLIQEDIVTLKYELLKLERFLQNVCACLGISHKFMSFTDPELVDWYNKAKKYVETPGYDNTKFPFKEWIVFLHNIGEDQMERLRRLTDDPMPFMPFFRLIQKVIALAGPRKDKNARGPYLFMDWIYQFMLARGELRKKAIIFLSEERPSTNPINIVDMQLSKIITPNDVEQMIPNHLPEDGATIQDSGTDSSAAPIR